MPRHAGRLGDKPALIDGPSGRVLTYRQLADGVARAAASLRRRGFGKGDVLAIYTTIESLGWLAFVELPVAEANAPAP